jgi:hypothetical protein
MNNLLQQWLNAKSILRNHQTTEKSEGSVTVHHMKEVTYIIILLRILKIKELQVYTP